MVLLITNYCVVHCVSSSHTPSAIRRDLVSKVATTHIASNDVGTILILSTYSQSTLVYKLFGHILLRSVIVIHSCQNVFFC